MIETLPSLAPNDRVRVSGRYELGIGEVLRVCEAGGLYVADVVFKVALAAGWKRCPSNGWKELLPPGKNCALEISISQKIFCCASSHGNSRWGTRGVN